MTFADRARAISEPLYHAVRATEILADVMLKHYGGGYEIEWDESEYDPRTGLGLEDSPGAIKLAVDRMCDRLAREYLTSLYPDYGFVGEESFDPAAMEADTFWCVDPICGSMGYYRRTGHFGTSIALVDRKRGSRLGVMNCPVLNLRGLVDLEGGEFLLEGDFRDPAPVDGLRVVGSPHSANHPLMKAVMAALKPGLVDLQQSIPTKALAILYGTYDLNFGLPKEDSGFAAKIWDLAAVVPFFKAADMTLIDFRGRDITVTGESEKYFRYGYIMAREEKTAATLLKIYDEVTK